MRGITKWRFTFEALSFSAEVALRRTLAIAVIFLAAATPLAAQQTVLDPRAASILRSMGDYLASAEELSFSAEVAYDAVSPDGRKLQYSGTARVALRRPNRLHVEYDGDEDRRTVVIDGQTFTFYDRENNLYARTDVPSPIDAAIDHAFELYGFSVPIADLVYTDPYQTLMENVQSGSVIGRHTVDGVICDHLAFSQETIDWQIWIEDGPRPVPRKLVITYKSEPGSPQYAARLSGWDFAPRLSDRYFEFSPRPGAAEMEFIDVETMTEEVDKRGER
jgi:hypothetical protein